MQAWWESAKPNTRKYSAAFKQPLSAIGERRGREEEL